MAFKPQKNLTRGRLVHCGKGGQGGGRDGQQAQGQTGVGQACDKPHVRRHSAAGDLIATEPATSAQTIGAEGTLTEHNGGVGHQLHRDRQALRGTASSRHSWQRVSGPDRHAHACHASVSVTASVPPPCSR